MSENVSKRAKKLLETPPGIVGYCRLERPKETSTPKFKLQLHLTPDALDRLEADLARAISLLMVDLRKTVAAPMRAPDAAAWLSSRLKPARSHHAYSLPFIQFNARADFTKSIRAWDAKGRELDLIRLRPGRGSTATALVRPAIYTQDGDLSLALHLVGLRVLQLKRWDAAYAAAEPPPIEAGALALLGPDFTPDDLCPYRAAPKRPGP